MIRLTQRGLECLEESDKHKDEAERKLPSVLTPEERETFLGLIKKISESLE